MGYRAYTSEEWAKMKDRFPDDKREYFKDVLVALAKKAEQGDVSAIEWLERRGFVKFPTMLDR